MTTILIVGNSGSGKSTLAKQLVKDKGLAHLDLDNFAWQPTTPPTRLPLDDALQQINQFTAQHNAWIIEGCYGDLLELIAPQASQLIYLNLSTAQCVQHAKSRPWEPHKYASPAAQDANLTMLIAWINDYPTREDSTGQAAHQKLYAQFCGEKNMRTTS